MQTVIVAFFHSVKYNSKKRRKARPVMDEIRTERRRTTWEIIKEDYLPYLFLLGAAVVCIIFILGALIRG